MKATADGSDELDLARHLLRDGRAEQALAIVDRVAGSVSNDAGPSGTAVAGDVRRADALTVRLAALINLHRTSEYAATVDAGFEAARAHPDPARYGLLHALSALVAHHHGSLEQCVTHLVRSTQMLGTIEITDVTTVRAWHNLAISYSYTGFHGQAAAAIERARQIATAIGMPSANLAAPGLRLRLAVSLDQRGDTDACVRILRDMARDLAARRRTGELDGMRPTYRRAYGYGLARLAALGQSGDDDVDLRALLAAPDDSASARDMATLGAVCLAIAGRRAIEAAARLETVELRDETFGPAEIARLRALTHLAAGDHTSAYDADRQAFREASAHWERLRDLFVDGVAARLDHENVRRSAARYAAEELTDPLTGLPNRRQVELYVDQMLAEGARAVIGVCDINELNGVNTAHGRHSGDMVIQRVAGILNRVMRRGDFVARYRGDQFAVVLPTTSAAEASEIARRIVYAVAAEGWAALVPGTPIRVTIGWAGTSGKVPFVSAGEAFESADRALLLAKAASSPRPVTSTGDGR